MFSCVLVYFPVMTQSTRYLPALSFKRLTPIYDSFTRWTMRERTFKTALIAQANIGKGQRVLDLGCGTATLALQIKQTQPEAEVVGIDIDPEMLAMGWAKARNAGLALMLEEGSAYQLPYPANSFDRVLSSLVMHHLTTANRHRALAEAFRVLKPGGELHVADYGKPHRLSTLIISKAMRHLEYTTDLIDGLLPEMIRRAGFVNDEEPGNFTTVFGTLTLYKATKPVS